MTILGKIVLFLNIPAVIAAIYFAAQSWSLKQSENATALKYYLILQGEPEDAPEFDSLFNEEQKAAYAALTPQEINTYLDAFKSVS